MKGQGFEQQFWQKDYAMKVLEVIGRSEEKLGLVSVTSLLEFALGFLNQLKVKILGVIDKIPEIPRDIPVYTDYLLAKFVFTHLKVCDNEDYTFHALESLVKAGYFDLDVFYVRLHDQHQVEVYVNTLLTIGRKNKIDINDFTRKGVANVTYILVPQKKEIKKVAKNIVLFDPLMQHGLINIDSTGKEASLGMAATRQIISEIRSGNSDKHLQLIEEAIFNDKNNPIFSIIISLIFALQLRKKEEFSDVMQYYNDRLNTPSCDVCNCNQKQRKLRRTLDKIYGDGNCNEVDDYSCL